MTLTPYRRFAVILAVFAASLLWFAAGVEKSGIASVNCDPVSGISSQDEAVYSSEAIHIAENGNWLTPVYMGRFIFNKPPLLQISMALSLRLFGVKAWSLRAPSLVAAALVAAMLFAVVWWNNQFLAAGICAVLLIACSHLFYTFSRLSMMDMLLTFWVTAAMLALYSDPALKRYRTLWIFGVCSGAAILTKAAAGAIPIIALAIHWLLASRDSRPPVSRIVRAAGIAALVALPWHVYQLAVHTRWFLEEYVMAAHFRVGLAAPPEYTTESHLTFYARRLFLTDPVLSIFALAGVVFAVRRRQSVSLSWIAAILLALFAFRHRSANYLLPLLPALAFAAAQALAMLSRRTQSMLAVLLLASGVVKVVSNSPVWSLPVNVPSARAAAPVLERYCHLRRGNGLIIIDPDDEFYASVLSIPRLRYALLGDQPPPPDFDFGSLGIWMPASQFAHLDQWLPVYEPRLNSFGLHSTAAIPTVIWTPPNEMNGMIAAHPESDFLLPAHFARSMNSTAEWTMAPANEGRVFLLSRMGLPYSGTSCCGL